MDFASEEHLVIRREFGEFLDSDFSRETGVGRYVKRVDDIIKQYPQTKRVRLEVDLQGAMAARGGTGACSPGAALHRARNLN